MSDPLDDLLARPTPDAARELLGWRLASELDGARVVGRIVETEAYLAEGDGASHSVRGPTMRNASMFLAPGHAYVYLIYGMHHCFNIVTAPRGVGEAVLVRALEPLEGVATMRARRGARCTERDLCRGPGRLCQALAIGRAVDGHELRRSPLWLLPPEREQDSSLRSIALVTARVGITKASHLPLRFRAPSSRWTS